MRRRLDADKRRDEILTAAIDLSLKHGYRNITQQKVATKARVSKSLISWHFANMDELKRMVMAKAIDEMILPIIAQGVLLGDKQTQKISKSIKKRLAHYVSI